MKTKLAVCLLISASALSASAATVWLENGGKEIRTTGDALDKIRNQAVTADVVEIPGLVMTAQTLAETQEINALSQSLWVINTTDPENDRSCFDQGDAIQLSFDQAVRITGIDFNHFDKDEQFTLTIGSEQHLISYEALANKSADTYQCDHLIPEGTAIQLSVTAEGNTIGLDALEIELANATDLSSAATPEKDPLLSALKN
jgi:hypothetical protein